MEASDEVSIKTLLKFTTICGTFPPEKPSRWLYTYQIFIFIFNLLYSVFCIYCIITEMYFERNPLDVVLGTLTSLLAAMQGLSFQIACLWFPGAWKNLYENLNIDFAAFQTRKLWIFLEIFIINAFFFTRLALGVWIWYSLSGIYVLMYHNFRHINDYFCMVSVLLLVHVNIVIKKKCLLMNDILMHSYCTRNIQATYLQITQLIENFNVAVGYQTLLLLAHTMLVILQSLQDVLWLNNYDPKILLWHVVYSSSLIVI